MIREELKQLKTGNRELRNFGLLVGGVFGALAAWFLWRGKPVHIIFWCLAAPLILVGLVYPKGLRLVYLAWMTLAMIMGTVMSTVLLTLLFYVVVTPIGLAARIAGKDFLSLRLVPANPSYWIKRDRATKTAADYEQQF